MSKAKARGKINPLILDEASEWFVELSEGGVDVKHRADFNTWLRRSPEHVRAYLEISALWEDTKRFADRVQAGDAEIIARAVAEENVVALRAIACSPAMEAMAAPERRASRRRPKFAIAASLALMGSSLLGIYAWQQRLPTYATSVGEQRSISLADGSTVELNARSKVRIELGEHERAVHLLEGQAIFRVAKDPHRPFVVHSGATRVRAVGTEFDVYRKGAGTVVTVLEGTVAVLPTSAPWPAEFAATSAATDSTSHGAGPAITAAETQAESTEHSSLPDANGGLLLAAGQQAVVTAQSVEMPKSADIEAATAWTQRRVVFDSTRLDDAIDELNRYSARELVLHDNELAAYHISGTFSAVDPQRFLRFLEQRFDVRVVESASRIEIQREKS